MTLPQSKVIVASLFIGGDSAVFEANDSAAHPIDDRLIVRCHDDGRAFEVDSLQQRRDFGRVRRVEISGRLVAEQKFWDY